MKRLTIRVTLVLGGLLSLWTNVVAGAPPQVVDWLP